MGKKQSVGTKAAKGAVWTVTQKFASIGISFVSGIVLARLLMPEDYGAIGMLSIFMVVAGQFLDGGFGTALIQKKNPTQVDYSTVFWWNLVISMVLYVILYFCALPISKFYDMPILCSVLRVQALVLIISAINMVQGNQLTKQFRFKEKAIISLVTSVLALSVTIWMAYKGYGIWALVAQHLLTALIPMFAYIIVVRWRPQFVFSSQSFKELFSFGVYVFLSHLLNKFCDNIQGLLIGKIYSAGTMGYYSKARSTELLASRSIEETLTRVTFPLYSELQSDKEALADMVKKVTLAVAYLSFPLMFLLALIARPVFILLYSDRWVESIPYFQVLCIGGLAICLQSVNLQTISAIGKSKVMFNWTVVKRVISLSLMVLGLYFLGIYGLLIASVIVSWMIYIINAGLVSKFVGYKIGSQVKDLAPVMMLSVFSCALAWLVSRLLGLSMYPEGAVRLVIFVTSYLGLSLFFKMEAFDFCMRLLKSFFKRK